MSQTIDDFLTGDWVLNPIILGEGSDRVDRPGTMIGGMREVGVTVTSNPRQQPVRVDVAISPGSLNVSAGPKAHTQVAVNYNGSGGRRLDVDFSSFTEFRLHFEACDVLLSCVVNAHSDAGRSAADVTAGPVNPAANPSSFVVNVPFREFNGPPITQNRIQVLQFIFGGWAGWTLTRLEVV